MLQGKECMRRKSELGESCLPLTGFFLSCTQNVQQVEQMNLFNESRDCLTNKGILRHSLLGGGRERERLSIS